jgi:hypothetical protein
MKELSELALIAALLLVSLTVIYCTDAILQEMAASRQLLANELEGKNGYYGEGLKPSAKDSGVTAQRHGA